MNISLGFLKVTKKSKQNRFRIQSLAELAKTDGNFDEREFEYIVKVANRLGISRNKLNQIIEKPKKVDMTITSINQKLKMIFDLLELALADTHFDERERKMIENFGIKLNLPGNVIKELVESMAQNIQNGNDFAETLKRVDFLVAQDVKVDLS